jgi:hypothetical protein
MKTKGRIIGFLSFAVAIGVIVVVLKVANWVPLLVQKDSLRRYGSIDEVKTSLNIREIYVPSYFPQNISWPPSEVLAQGKPFPAIVMEFNKRDSTEIVLILTQSQGGPFPAGHTIEMTSVKETVPFMMRGRSAELIVGECVKNETCSRITWKEGAYTVTALMKAAPFELIKIADSMIR